MRVNFFRLKSRRNPCNVLMAPSPKAAEVGPNEQVSLNRVADLLGIPPAEVRMLLEAGHLRRNPDDGKVRGEHLQDLLGKLEPVHFAEAEAEEEEDEEPTPKAARKVKAPPVDEDEDEEGEPEGDREVWVLAPLSNLRGVLSRFMGRQDEEDEDEPEPVKLVKSNPKGKRK